jgi:hypothetical protein
MAVKLYRVRTTKARFKGHSNVGITGVAIDRKKQPVRYAVAIDGLSTDEEAKEQQRQAVDELFTQEQAEKWVAYLRKYYEGRSEMLEVGTLGLTPERVFVSP